MLGSPSRIIISALKGASGKTIISLGLASAWRKRGHKVAPFKKGPDFIDSGWLAFASARPCHNLDPFMMTDQQILRSFLSNSMDSDVSLIEGNRGLFDGLDLDGCCSTAELARILKAPVILIVDVTMVTRTVAALVMGCQKFDPQVGIGAVILNRVAGPRQESLVRNAVEQYCGIPVVGAIPKLKEDIFPERHMGLIPHLERLYAERAIEGVRTIVEENLDLEALWRLANEAGPIGRDVALDQKGTGPSPCLDPLRIGVIRDNAFWFYYPENVEKLKGLGAEIIEIDSLAEQELPDLDALYIGGGFPETQAGVLAGNQRFRASLRREIEKGLPVYAECGGLMYLGESLFVDGKSFPMVGAFPVEFVLEKRPQGHGYTILEVIHENPYYPLGELLKGHEFHYSKPVFLRSEKFTPVFKVRRGRGFDGEGDGLSTKNVLATYTHLHAGGYPQWGESFFRRALEAKASRKLEFLK
ncbi:MAG: cobyrinate a,c-diamide synthase [Pseudomonadota bacterium]